MALSKADFNNINVTPAASKKLKWNASANGFETGDVGGSMVLLSTQTASGSANLSFTSGIDSTYKEYVFKFIDIHPATDSVTFQFNVSIDGGSNYNVAKTTTVFEARHNEADDTASLGYDGRTLSEDLAQGTGYQHIAYTIGNDNDQCAVGTLQLFNPSSTTFVKHFICVTNSYLASDYLYNWFSAGYVNTTSAVNAVQFNLTSGNIDSGTIKMYGVV